jgi:hypothetical protein
MNLDHKNIISSHIKNLKLIDIDSKIASSYKEYNDLTKVNIGYYTVEEFTNVFKKTILEFDKIINSSIFQSLPFSYQFQNDFGGGNLNEDFLNLLNFITNNDYPNAVTFLYKLNYYLIIHGFWFNSSEKDYSIKINELESTENQIKLYVKSIQELSAQNSTLIKGLEDEKNKLSLFIDTKNKELEQINNLLPSARNSSEEISRLLNVSTENNQKIISLIEVQNQKIIEIENKLKIENQNYAEYQKEFAEFKTNLNTEIDKNQKTNLDFNLLLTSVSDKSKTFDERLLVLNELIGKEGAVKLFSTFKDRKEDLKKPVRNWAIAVVSVGILALGMTISIFTNFFGQMGGYPTSIDWQFLVINSLKSTPIIIVLYFTIRQYVRERTFQEEYAFRSAIALTVQAYSEIAGSRKEELIFNAVTSIYNTPSVMKEKSMTLFGSKSKLIADSLKEINEALKTIKK